MVMIEHTVTCLKEPMLNIISSNNLCLNHSFVQSHQAARAGIHTFEPENCKEFVHQFSLAQLNSQSYYSSTNNCCYNKMQLYLIAHGHCLFVYACLVLIYAHGAPNGRIICDVGLQHMTI